MCTFVNIGRIYRVVKGKKNPGKPGFYTIQYLSLTRHQQNFLWYYTFLQLIIGEPPNSFLEGSVFPSKNFFRQRGFFSKTPDTRFGISYIFFYSTSQWWA